MGSLALLPRPSNERTNGVPRRSLFAQVAHGPIITELIFTARGRVNVIAGKRLMESASVLVIIIGVR